MNYNISKKESQLAKFGRAKRKNLQIAEWLRETNQTMRASRLQNCGEFIMWKYCKHCHHSEIINANYCKDRFCAICAPKKANRIRFQIMQAIEPYIKNNGIEWLFLTVTVKSIEIGELRQTVNGILSASRKFFDRRPIERAVLGYVRSLEITYNQKTKQYHPHIHILLAVDKKQYFQKGIYLSQEDYANIWQECAKIDYTPITDIRKVYKKDGYSSIKSAVIETAKYPVKLFDIPNKEVLTALDCALKGKQLISAGGILRTHWRIAQNTESKECCTAPDIVTELYKWNTNGYEIIND